ncbi:MAG: hypothetical protein OXE52_09765 [Chloroflexi bacterium]|nr:hypothetical protein [Chloroflexota bacterium]
MHRVLVILLVGFVIMVGAVQAYDGGHCTEEEFLEFDARVEAWMEESEARAFDTASDGYEVYEAFLLADEALWEGGADMSAMPPLCAETAPIYLAAERISRALIFHYIWGLDELLPAQNRMRSWEKARMREMLRAELENAISRFFEALQAGYVAFGLEWWGEDYLSDSG